MVVNSGYHTYQGAVPDDYEAKVNNSKKQNWMMIRRGKLEKLREKPAPVPLCPPSDLNQEMNLRLHGD
jgi:hypothetical protein